MNGRLTTIPVLLLLACAVDDKETVLFGDELGADPVDTTPADTDLPATDDTADTDVPDPVDTGSADTAIDTGNPDPLWEREFDILVTADDSWTLYIDGNTYVSAAQDDWRISDRIVVDIQGRQRQVVAIHARDNHAVISGLIAVVHVSQELYSVTGDGQWKMTTTPPPADWVDPAFDDSSWSPAYACPASETSVWGTYWIADFVQYNAAWIWHGSCRDLGEAWFRLVVD
jgi:hypothetical protein